MKNTYLRKFACTAIVMACTTGNLLAASAKNQGPAGQRCPAGSYVIGFDPQTNIICSDERGNDILVNGGTSADGNRETGNDFQTEVTKPGKAVEENTAKTAPEETILPPDVESLVISNVTPSKLLFGTPELVITVNGTGFKPGAVVLFEGKEYTSRINQAGTRLEATIPTGDLSIAPYTIKVSNGPGEEASLKRALEIY